MEGSIPDLISLTQIPVNYAQKIETDLLEPVVFNQGSSTTDGFCRFTLQNKGFLHSHSKLFLSVEANASVTNGYFNPVTGVGQVIKKAVLKIGNKTLNEVDTWDGLFAAKSSLIKAENNKEREQFTTGRWNTLQFEYDGESAVNSHRLKLDNGYEDNGNTLRVPEWAQIDGSAPAQSPTFSVDLSDLFPFLKVNQLPLYMIDEPINIELTFYPTAGDRIQIGDNASTGKEALIRRTDLKFCADYVYYGAGDEMARYAAANKDMSFSFVDYRAVESTITNAAVSSGVIRNVGMANRVVPRVVSLLSDNTLTETNLVTGRNAMSLNAPAEVIAQNLKYNIRYNDRFEFTTDVNNTARMFSILTDSEGVPFLNRSLYSNERAVMTTATVEGRPAQTGLDGHFFYMGTKLTGGRVGQRGIEFHLAGTFPTRAGGFVLRNYCEYLRVARLTDGMFSVFNA
jgi:hypothetical protein